MPLGFATSGADSDQSMDGPSLSNSTRTNHDAASILAGMIGRGHEWHGGRMACERWLSMPQDAEQGTKDLPQRKRSQAAAVSWRCSCLAATIESHARAMRFVL